MVRTGTVYGILLLTLELSDGSDVLVSTGLENAMC